MGASSCRACCKGAAAREEHEYAVDKKRAAGAEGEKEENEEEENEGSVLDRAPGDDGGLSPSPGHGNGSVSTRTPPSLQAPSLDACSDDLEEGSTAEKARDLIRRLQVFEAAALLQPGFHDQSVDADLQEALTLQLKCLGPALTMLGDHPGLRKTGIDAEQAAISALPPELLGVDVPASPEAARKLRSDKSSSPDSLWAGTDGLSGGKCDTSQRSPPSESKSESVKRDVVDVSFNLDDQGRRVEAEVEFFPDGMVQVQYVAVDLPVPLVYVMCMINEVDLIGDLVPFIHSAGVVHQFPLNEGDRLVQIVAKPPIPFVGGLEAVTQRFGFDLLDTPWEGVCLVDISPPWSDSNEKADAPELWRGAARPVSIKGVRQVDAKTMVALGRPAGKDGELTTVLFSAYGNLKVHRRLLPNQLLKWLLPLIGRYVYNRALERVAGFDSSEHGKRLRSSALYATVRAHIAKFAREKAEAEE